MGKGTEKQNCKMYTKHPPPAGGTLFAKEGWGFRAHPTKTASKEEKRVSWAQQVAPLRWRFEGQGRTEGIAPITVGGIEK